MTVEKAAVSPDAAVAQEAAERPTLAFLIRWGDLRERLRFPHEDPQEVDPKDWQISVQARDHVEVRGTYEDMVAFGLMAGAEEFFIWSPEKWDYDPYPAHEVPPSIAE
jgi:hypothetical protein